MDLMVAGLAFGLLRWPWWSPLAAWAAAMLGLYVIGLHDHPQMGAWLVALFLGYGFGRLLRYGWQRFRPVRSLT